MRDSGTLWELIERRAAETPDAQMAVDERGETLTFAGLRDRAERTAAGLAEMGVGEGTVVSWQLPTWIESMVLVGALARLQAVQNPILHIYREREVGFIIRQASSKLLLVPSEFRGFDFEQMARSLAEGTDTQVLVVDRNLPEADPSSLPPPPPTTNAEDAPVRWLFYTSGTTSDPKGAQHTDHTIAATARGMCERLELMADDRNALAFPFTHIGGIIWMFSGLMEGFSNILMEAFDPVGTPEVLQREGVTLAGSGTPFHMAYLAAQRKNPDTPLFPNVRVFPGGGAPKPPQLHYDIKRELGGVGIASGYGLTEAPILTMSSIHDDDEALANTEGSAMPGVELRAVTIEGERGRDRRGRRDPRQGAADDARLPRLVTGRRRVRRRRLVPHGRPRALDDDGNVDDHRAPEGRHHPQGREHQRQGGRGRPVRPPCDRRRRRDRPARSGGGRTLLRDRRRRRGAGGAIVRRTCRRSSPRRA